MGVKAFNVASLSKVHLVAPKEVGYQDSLDIIRDELHRTRRSFVKIGWYLKHIKDEEMFKTDGYADIFELALDKFNISQPTANRFMNICKEFSVNHDSPELDEKFVDYSVSQLFEMLPMDEEKREQITPDMTVKQIRDMKGDTQKKNEPDDGEIRDVCYDCLRDISDKDFEQLKEYMRERYGRTYCGVHSDKLCYKCTPRGISINDSDEITWAGFAKRVHFLNDLTPFRKPIAKEDDEIPGQTSIEKDFPEYMPDYPEEEEEPEIEEVRKPQLPASEANPEPPVNTGLSELTEDNKNVKKQQEIEAELPAVPEKETEEQPEPEICDVAETEKTEERISYSLKDVESVVSNQKQIWEQVLKCGALEEFFAKREQILHDALQLLYDSLQQTPLAEEEA